MDFSGISELLDSVMQDISPVWWGAGIAVVVILVLLVILVSRRRPPASEAEETDPAPLEAEETSPYPETEKPAPEPQEESPASRQPEAEPTGPGLFGRLKNGLAKTRTSFTGSLDRIFGSRQRIDEEALEDLEELLITSDIGVKTATELTGRIAARSSEYSDGDGLKRVLREEILAILEKSGVAAADDDRDVKPRIIMVVGVNGVGKTTTIGKLAARYTASGKKVLLAAADTFRAAAMEQLDIWAQRGGADIVRHRDGSDPAAVAYDAVEAALARDKDIVLVDTAGRLHTKVNLMEELKKIRRTIAKKLPGAPHDILLVLDATTGQNALSQATMFHEALGITAICLTKLDGTAKGGIVIGICNALQVPLAYIGVGESVEDLQDFDPVTFTQALF
jgi:fused signal recognition particle receptor